MKLFASDRKSNIELLRLLAGVFVVILHYNYLGDGGAMAYASGVNYYVLLGLEVISVTAVNIFILITGYCSAESYSLKPAKAVLLLLEVIFVNILLFAIKVLLGWKTFSVSGAVSCLIPQNWYVFLYIALILLAPFLSFLMDSLAPKKQRVLVLTCFVLFSVYAFLIDALRELTGTSLSGMSTVSSAGNNSGYTLVNFVLLYLIGCYLKKSGAERISVKILVPVLTGNLCLMYIIRLVLPGAAWPYCSPFLIAACVSMFLLFTKIPLKSKVINAIAPASFMCFLIHDSVLLRIGFSRFADAPLWKQLAHLAHTVFVIYVAAIVMQFVWDLFSAFVLKKLMKRIPVIHLKRDD